MPATARARSPLAARQPSRYFATVAFTSSAGLQMSHGLGRGGAEAALGLGPVDDLPDVLEVVGLNVLVVEVEAESQLS